MTEKKTLLDIRSLTKTFMHRGKSLTVLRDMDLKLYAGDTVSIMGPSGAGKSTLLHLLGTLDSPTSGIVSFGGEDIFARKPNALAKFRNED